MSDEIIEVQPKPEEPKPAAKPKKAASKAVKFALWFVVGTMSGLVIIALVTVAVFSLGIYKFKWSGPATDVAVHALPFPAATVNGTPILLSEYLDDIATLKRFYAKMSEREGAGFSAPSDDDIKKSALDRLVQNQILSEEAVRFDLTVADSEVDAEFDTLANERGGEQGLRDEILDLYGWTPEQFKSKVMRPYLLQQKLDEAIRSDEEMSGQAKEDAEKILAGLKAGADFAETAAKESDDYMSAQEGGDLGWFGKGTMVKEFEDAVFALEKGGISDLVKTQFGWHIIRLDDTKEEGGEVTEVRASHILVGFIGADQYIKDLVDKAEVKKFVE
jgi:foldase protein PrsA